MKPIKEQYKEIVCGWNEERTDNVANRCTEIADDYAIEFADWLIKRQTNYFESLTGLIEVFKKEKGL